MTGLRTTGSMVTISPTARAAIGSSSIFQSTMQNNFSAHRTQRYQHQEDGSLLIRTPQWSLPQSLHAHISTVQPTNSFMRTIPKRSTLKLPTRPISSSIQEDPAPLPKGATVAQACSNSLVTPDCLRTPSTAQSTIRHKPGNQSFMALCDYLGEVNLRSDATMYLQKYRPEAVAAASAFQQVSIAGGTLQQTLNSSQVSAQTGIEGNLDVQTMLGIAWPIPLTAFSTGGSNPEFIPDNATPTNTDEPYLAWVEYMLSLSSLPNIVSTSYGDDEQTVSPSYATAVCNAFAQTRRTRCLPSLQQRRLRRWLRQ